MTIVNKNDILFDDLAEIRLANTSNSSTNPSISYGDCSNRFEVQTARNCNNTSSAQTAITYGDCSN